MTLKPHACVEFHDHCVVLVCRHEISNEAFEEGNILRVGKIQLYSAKRFLRMINNVKAWKAQSASVRIDQLLKRLQSVADTPRIRARYDSEISPDTQHVRFGQGTAFDGLPACLGDSSANQRAF